MINTINQYKLVQIDKIHYIYHLNIIHNGLKQIKAKYMSFFID